MPGVADSLDGGPDARGPIAVGEAAHDPVHVDFASGQC